MYRTALVAADEQLRLAHGRLAERDRLTAIHAALAPDLAEAETEVTRLATTLAGEQQDVARYEGGVWAFLYDVFADREARLTKEQQEAIVAQLKHDDAVALRDRLRDEVATIAERITALQDADAELAEARTTKHGAVLATDSPAARDLEAISQQLGQLDAEARQLDEALAAGSRAHQVFGQLVETLRSAGNWGVADIMSGSSFFLSWVKRNKLDEARTLAATAQAEMTLFHRELADVGVALNLEISALADHHRWLDTWFDNIFSDISVQGRITDAHTSSRQTHAELTNVLERVRARRLEITAQLDELSAQRLRLIEPA